METETLEDCYQAMKIAGEIADEIFLAGHGDWFTNYYEARNLWWNAASIYVSKMKRLNDLSGNFPA